MSIRLITLFLIPLMISSCGLKTEKAAEKAAQKTETNKQEYLKKGEEIASLTQTELLKNVSQAMQTGGATYAIEFCNTRAMPLKDSLSRLNDCQIRRIAIKYRNPIDMPQTETEKEQLNKYQDAHEIGGSLDPEIYMFEDRIEYYQPIFLDKGACLVCHGSPGEQIADETLETIMAKYPNDLATGFALNDFRGAWKITFIKN